MRKFVSLSAMAMLAACSTTSDKAPTPPAPGVKVGRPYEIFGKTYVPRVESDYDEIGVASWYGPGFHGKYTANGEIFNQDDLTAAHTTLPMPSLVRVTNLENGRSLVVRINDRGPFRDDRIIDLSRESARQLGITGLARVRVQFLREETEQYWASMNAQAPAQPQFARTPDAAGEEVTTTIVTHADAPQVKSSAPVMSVSSNDLKPDELKIRPIQPRFRVIGEAEAADAEAEALPPRPQARLGAGRGWYVQAGAFASEENAAKLARRLEALGSVAMDVITSGGRTLHRVRVGPLASRSAAASLQEKVAVLGLPDARVVGE